MKNQTMQHAIAAAHKAEANKTHTVKAGTLSLAGNQNKRSTDVQASNMPAVAEAALAEAVQMLHDNATKGIEMTTTQNAVQTTEQTAKSGNVESIDIPRVVLRCDSRNLIYAFDVDSLSPAKKTLSMWDMTHGAAKEEVPLDFYKTLRPLTDPKQTDKTIKALTEKLGVNRLVVRARLVKNALERDEEGKVEPQDLEAFKKRLIESITKAILEA